MADFIQQLTLLIQAREHKLAQPITALSPNAFKWEDTDHQVFLAKKLQGALAACRHVIAQYLKASDLHLGPKVAWSEPEQGWMILHYAAGETFDPMHADANTLDDLAKLLAIAHNAPHANQNDDTLSCVDALCQSWQHLPKTLQVKLSPTLTLQQIREDVLALISDSATPCWCHQDFHPRNVLAQPKWMMLDWEHAGIGVPEIDLAMMQQYLPKHLHTAWHHAYRQHRLIEIDADVVARWVKVLQWKCVFWAVHQAHKLDPQKTQDLWPKIQNATTLPTPSDLRHSFLAGTFDMTSPEAWLTLAFSHAQALGAWSI